MKVTIRNNTTLQDLQQMLDHAGKDAKIYGKMSKGEIQLYTKPVTPQGFFAKVGNFLAKVTTYSAYRRNLARQGINTLIDRFKEATGDDKSRGIAEHLDGMFDSIKHAARGHDNSTRRANRVSDMRALVKLADGLQEISKVYKASETEKIDIDQAISKLSTDPVIVSQDGTTIKMRKDCGGMDVKLNNITLNGKTYVAEKHLASGGFGDVYLFSAGESDKIAFKISRPGTHLEAAVKELDMHSQLTETSGNHIVKLLGACKMPDGQVGIATEFAPHGDVDVISLSVHRLLKEGTLTKTQAEAVMLTLLQDMAKGLKAMHESNVTHFDFKSPNVLVDKDGVGKIADFGTSFEGETILFKKTEQIDSALFKAPELTKIQKDFNAGILARAIEDKKLVENQLAGLYPNKDEGDIKNMILDISTPKVDRLTDEAESPSLDKTKSYDVWGLGASAIHMLTGNYALEHSRLRPNLQEDQLKLFSQSDKPAIRNRGEGDDKTGVPIALPSGDDQIDDFLNSILKSNPQQRLSLDGIISNDLFKRPGVNSDEARNLIKAIASNDIDKINSAKEGL